MKAASNLAGRYRVEVTFSDRSGRILTGRTDNPDFYTDLLTIVFDENPGAEWRLIPEGEK